MYSNSKSTSCAQTKLIFSDLPEKEDRAQIPAVEAMIAIGLKRFNPKGLSFKINNRKLDKQEVKSLNTTGGTSIVGKSIFADVNCKNGGFFFATFTSNNNEHGLDSFKDEHPDAHFFMKTKKQIQAIYLVEGGQDECTNLKKAMHASKITGFSATRSFKVPEGEYSINKLEPSVNIYKFSSLFGADENLKQKKFEPKKIELKTLDKSMMPDLLYIFSMIPHIGSLETSDYVFAKTLTIFGTLAAKGFKVSSDNSIGIAPVIWSACIGRPGTGKTPTQRALLDLFSEFQLSQAAITGSKASETLEKIAVRVVHSNISKKMKDELDTQNAIHIDRYSRKRLENALIKKSKKTLRPSGKILTVTDLTGAGLVELLKGDKFSILYVEDELEKGMMYLARTDQAVLRGILLQSESGSAEIGKARAEDFSQIKNAAVAMMANIQDDLLMNMIREVESKNDGFLNRLQLAVYNTTKRDKTYDEEALNIKDKMCEFMAFLSESVAKLDKTQIVNLNKKAISKYDRFIEKLEGAIEKSPNSSVFVSHILKYSGSVLRIALIYQFILEFEKDDSLLGKNFEVSDQAFEMAEKTILYLKSHAAKAFKVETDRLHQEAKFLLKRLLELPTSFEFTASNIAQKNWQFTQRDTEKVEKLLDYLLSFGLVTCKQEPRKVVWKVRTATRLIKL